MTGAITSKTSTTSAKSSTSVPVSESPIREFYAGKSIVVTGSTGFIGKVLIEKLLYSCPDVKKIYLLIRSAGGMSPHARMLEMVAQRPFDIRVKQETVLSKLVAIDSDLSKHKLGLSAESQRLLIDEVSIIFHVAASVKFEAPLEVNMRHNVMATRELLQFARTFKQLACFVHVSTAYSNCQLRQIDERIYHMDVPDDPISLEVTKEMLESRPNTYTYTKAMAENVAGRYSDCMNVVIVRPSIVMSALSEPTEGWVDTINGPVGLSVLGALGILQKIKVNSEVVFDLIPVDIVANALVAIAWASTEKKAEFGSAKSRSLLANGASPTSSADTTEPKVKSVADSGQSQRRVQANGVLEELNNNTNESSVNGTKKTLANCSGKLAALPIASAASKFFGRQQFAAINSTATTTSSNAQTIKSQTITTTATTATTTTVATARNPNNSNSSTNNSNSNTTNNGNNNHQLKQSHKTPDITLTPEREAQVFNLTTGSENPCSFYKYFSIGREAAYKLPSSRALRPLLTIPKQKGMNPVQYWIHKMLTHLLFAHLIDLVLTLVGQKRMVVKAVNRMHHANEVFDYFCSNQWNFNTDNVKRLRELQSHADRATFNCDVRKIDWNLYAEIGWLGCRRFILNEPDETVEQARVRYKTVCRVYYACKFSLLLIFTSAAYYFISSQIVLATTLMPIYGVIYLL